MGLRGKKPRAKVYSPALLKRIASLIFDGFNDDDVSFLVGLPIAHIREIRAGKDHKVVRQAVLQSQGSDH